MSAGGCDVTRAVGLSMTTIFDLESIDDKDLSAALRDADKAATLARLAVEGLMVKNTHSVVIAADLNLVQECIYTATAHAWHAYTLHRDDLRMRTQIHPPLNEPVTHGTRFADCPVCGAAIIAEAVECERCDPRLHGECYYGRVATLAEWQDYIRDVNGGPEDYSPTVVCAQCRAKGLGQQQSGER